MSSPRAITTSLIALLVCGLALSGCGGSSGDGDEAKSSSSSPEAGETPSSAPTATQTAQAEETIKPSPTVLTSAPGSSVLPAPEQAPKLVHGFPVPPGARVKDPGAIDKTWQFDIHTADPNKTIDFYKRVLPQLGYTVRTNVTYRVGYEDVKWDLAFDGQSSGTMARDPDNGLVFVIVNGPGQSVD